MSPSSVQLAGTFLAVCLGKQGLLFLSYEIQHNQLCSCEPLASGGSQHIWYSTPIPESAGLACALVRSYFDQEERQDYQTLSLL